MCGFAQRPEEGIQVPVPGVAGVLGTECQPLEVQLLSHLPRVFHFLSNYFALKVYFFLFRCMFVYVSLCEWRCPWKSEERGGLPGVMGIWALSV